MDRKMRTHLLLKRINPGPTKDRRPFLKPLADHLLSDAFYIGLNLLHSYHVLSDIPTYHLSAPNTTTTSLPAFRTRLCDICANYLALIAGW